METKAPPSEATTPASEAALVALVRDAAERGHAVVTEGGGTKRHFGPAAPAHARRVSLRALARVTAHEPADLILSVEAGARLRDVQAVLAAHDQWLPLDPPFADGGATIGGVLATNASGPRRLGYGTSRDLLLGLRVVGPAGQVTKSGGRVVKNVSGYDLHRPQVGAFGTLGVIVEAHLKVSARPETSALWVLPCATLDAAHRLLLEVGATALRPVALEALDASDASNVRARWPGLPGAPSQAVALVGIEGTRASFERHARDLAPYAVRAEGTAAVIVERPDVDALWAALADLPAAHAGDVRVRIGARPHELPALLAAIEAQGAAVRGARVGAGVGVAHLSLASDVGAPALAEIVARWRRRAAPRGAYAVVESAPVDLPARASLPFGPMEGAGAGLDAALRRAWDPRGTLNPGRMAS